MTVQTICRGCGAITPHAQDGRCADCKPAHERQRNRQPTRKAHHTLTHQRVKRIVYARDSHRCAECGTTQDLTIDYIRPLAHGGPMHSTNARILCRPCNSSKGART